MTASVLFEYRFKSDLEPSRVAALEERLGMVVGDVRDPRKDNPGKAVLGDRVLLGLFRMDESDWWKLIAFTSGGEPPSRESEYREAVLSVVQQISDSWYEAEIRQPDDGRARS